MLRPSLDERRQFLADIAIEVFARNGYMATSLQDIADEANISKAGLYHYFNSKEDLLYYALENAHNFFLKELEECTKSSAERGLTPEESLRRLIYTYANFINRRKALRLVVLQDRHQLTGENKINLRTIERAMLRALKDQVKKTPQINKKYDPNVISFMVVAVSHWLGFWVKDGGSLNLDDAIKESTDIIFYGIYGKKS